MSTNSVLPLGCDTEDLIYNTVDGNYTYIGYATDDSGTGFNLTYDDDTHTHKAIKTSDSEISNPSVSDFTGLWMKIVKDGDSFDYNYVGNFNTDLKSTYNALAVGSVNASSPSCYYYSGTYKRFYYTYFGNNLDADSNSKAAGQTVSYVGYYDIDNKVISRDVAIPHTYPTNTDLHNVPSIIVADDGRILVFQESLLPSGLHNSSIEVWRSDAAETIENPTSPGTHYFTKVAEFGYPTTGTTSLSYPKVTKGSATGEIFLQARGNNASNGHANLVFCKSTDNGATWDDLSGTSNLLTLVADCNPTSDTLDWYFYHNNLRNKRENGIAVLGMGNEGLSGTNPASSQAAASRYKVFWYLHSYDGITWGNIVYFTSGGISGFSKNILTGGAITRAELDANCSVVDENATADVSITPFVSGCDSTGMPYIFWQKFTRPVTKTGDAENLINVYFTYYDTLSSAWVDVDLTTIVLDKFTTADTNTNIFYNRGEMVNYSPGVADVIVYRYAGTENPTVSSKYEVITSDADRIVGAIYKVNTTTLNHFGTDIVAGDIIQVTSSTPSCGASDTLISFDTEIVVLRTQNYGVTWEEVKTLIKPSDSIISMNSNNAVTNFNYLDDKKLLLMIGIPRSSNSTALTHTDFDLYYGKID